MPAWQQTVGLPVSHTVSSRPAGRSTHLRGSEPCPNLFIAQTAGAGHWNVLEVPDQVNAMIERFLAISFRNRQ
jgi:hypothetical protein